MTRIYVDLINGRNLLKIKEKFNVNPTIADDVLCIEIMFEVTHSQDISRLHEISEELINKYSTSQYLTKYPWINIKNQNWILDLNAIRSLNENLKNMEWLKGTILAKPSLKLIECQVDPEVRTTCYLCGIQIILKQDEVQKYVSCFISYSHKDESFAKYIFSNLTIKTDCWFAPEDMEIGDKIRDEIDNNILQADRLLLVLSTNSINSQWVEKEVETAFEKERMSGQVFLLPIRIDDSVLDTKKPWAADIRRTRHIGDFTDWADDVCFESALEKLLRALQIR